jgi:hypothetical protein
MFYIITKKTSLSLFLPPRVFNPIILWEFDDAIFGQSTPFRMANKPTKNDIHNRDVWELS